MSSTESKPLQDAVLYLVDGALPVADEVLTAIAEYALAHRFVCLGVALYNVAYGLDCIYDVSPFSAELPKRLLAYASKVKSLAEPDPQCISLLKALHFAKEHFEGLQSSYYLRLVVVADYCIQPSEVTANELREALHAITMGGALVVPALVSYMDVKGEKEGFWQGKPVVRPDRERIVQFVCQKTTRKKPIFRGTLILRGMPIGIGVYSVERSGNGNLNTPHRLATGDERGETKPKADRLFKLKFGEVPVTVEENAELKSIPFSHRIDILSFVPVDSCVLFEDMRLYKSLFLVGSNLTVANSRVAFASLHRSMNRKKVCALATLWLHTMPVRGLLYASTNATYTPEGPSTKNGMFFVKLPFVEDTRELLEVPEPAAVSLNLDSKAAKLVQTLISAKSFDPLDFTNPRSEQALKVRNWALLGDSYCSALELRKEPPDSTKPNYMRLTQISAKLCQSINTELDKVAGPVATELHNANNSSSPGPGKARSRPDAAGQPKSTMSAAAIQQLQQSLRGYGLNANGTPDELLARLVSHVRGLL